MNPIRHTRRAIAILAGLAATALAAFGAASPFASMPVPYPDEGYAGPVANATQVQVPAIVAGGMPGWQIALIAVGAALLAAAIAVPADRARRARRRTATTAA